MIVIYLIPLNSDPNQNFRCTIPINGSNITLLFGLRYNTEAHYWVMSITDDLTGHMLIDSVPLISGEYPSANLLEQYAFLRIGSATIVKTNPDNYTLMPDDKNLGTDFQLIWSDNFE